MGRWGNAIYESDAALDYHATVTDRLERELAYWLLPELVIDQSWWLAQVLTVVELILLFEQHHFGSTVYLSDEKAVRRWREVFLSVWDGAWQDKDQYSYAPYVYSEPEYRQQHRPAIVKMFDRLESIARSWANLANSQGEPILTSLSDDYPLPFFSIRRWTNQYNVDGISVERFTNDLIEHLVKDIIYLLSSEKRAEALVFDTEEVWVAVDILGFLCGDYETSPGVNEQVVRAWRDTTLQIGKQFRAGSQAVWDESDSLYRNIIDAFSRLEAVTQQYPPYDW